VTNPTNPTNAYTVPSVSITTARTGAIYQRIAVCSKSERKSMSRLQVELDISRIQYQINGLSFSMLGVMQLNNIGQKLAYATGSYVPCSNGRDVMEKRPLCGHSSHSEFS